ncbi:MAG: flagellar biosynthesis anti-sigma factor FlgM [Acidobacteriia bacterium]|jgi:flagellar biosynthesis anti-sigma factor FlgM|nr:flagellar biosynthesis anti-sigma factor FlgM [Terriglobia bacterium]
MRIDLTNIRFQGPESDDKTRKAGSRAPSTPNVEDKASLSTDALSISSLEAQAMATPPVRQDKVEALRQSIQNGDYRVEADKIAHAILEHNQR